MRALRNFVLNRHILDENWTMRLPNFFIIGFTTNRRFVCLEMFKEVFEDIDILLHPKPITDYSQDAIDSRLRQLSEPAGSQFVIEHFPVSVEHAVQLEEEIGGLNLFINFRSKSHIACRPRPFGRAFIANNIPVVSHKPTLAVSIKQTKSETEPLNLTWQRTIRVFSRPRAFWTFTKKEVFC